ncbi:multicopper oxidase family protein [soil metagenome]
MFTDRSDLLNRRRFLQLTAARGGLLLAGGAAWVAGCDRLPTGVEESEAGRTPLRLPTAVSATGLSLAAAPGMAMIGATESTGAWMYNGLLPAPTIRARRGDIASIQFVNGLPEESIVHWHGLLVPEEMDGHPSYVVGPGESYNYTFPIVQRAGTYWYHPHAHHMTGSQVYKGLAGFFIIGDAEEDALDLPGGNREIALLLQDRNEMGFDFAPTDADMWDGMLGDVPFGNGIRTPALEVTADSYRFRVLNGSQARVYRLGFSNGSPLTVIGNDGGLLPAPVQVESVYLGVGERVDFVTHFPSSQLGQHLMLKSLPFAIAAPQQARHPQGMEMDLLEIAVSGAAVAPRWHPPGNLSSVPTLSAANAAAERSFSFTSTAGNTHRINGLSFAMDRVDEVVPFGQVERWTFHNHSELPHPVHLHGTQFQVASRIGGRNTVYPYEGGWKDTVLVMPEERVEVLVSFDAYGGLFLLHCHNLQHEDMGMMLNINVA